MQPYGAWPPPPPPPQRSSGGAVVAIVITVAALLFVAIAFAFVGVWFYAKRSASTAYTIRTTTGTSTHSSSGSGWSDATSPIPVTSADPMWGDREAPITIVMFEDFEDPFAARGVPTLDSVEKLYGPAVVRVLWKNNPQAWHLHAKDAAEAAYGCFDLKDSSAFWHFEERAYANQKSLDQASFETWASESAVDLVKFRDGMSTHKWAAKVDEDATLAKSLHVYTGQAFVNGIKIYSTSALATWQKTIDDELPKARAALAGGVAGDQIYVNRSTANYAAAPTSTYVPPTTAGAIVYRVPVAGSPARGPNDALVTIVEFADFQCPFCNRLESTLEALRTKYGSDLRIVWKNEPLPFHTRALPAAELALEARAEKGDAVFWSVHDELYRSQGTHFDDATLMSIARAYGVDQTKAKAAIATNKYQTIIDTDHSLAKTVGVSGTPNCFINGRSLSGSQPQSVFETAIDEELIKARARVSKGTPRAKIYDEIMSTATL